jgi:hypothetical protein
MLGKTPKGASQHGTAVLGITPLHPADDLKAHARSWGERGNDARAPVAVSCMCFEAVEAAGSVTRRRTAQQ